MAGRFAAETSVSVESSRAEIERTLARYGATHFGYMTDPGRAVLAFQCHGRRVRFELTLPARGAREFMHTPARGRMRSNNEALAAWEQACRQRWRALCLVIKAKLESVECGISTFEEEFLANIVMPDGTTLGRWAVPQIAAMYETGQMPPMLAHKRGEGDDR